MVGEDLERYCLLESFPTELVEKGLHIHKFGGLAIILVHSLLFLLLVLEFDCLCATFFVISKIESRIQFYLGCLHSAHFKLIESIPLLESTRFCTHVLADQTSCKSTEWLRVEIGVECVHLSRVDVEAPHAEGDVRLVVEHEVEGLGLGGARDQHRLPVVQREVGLLDRDGHELVARHHEATEVDDISTEDAELAAAEHLLVHVRVDRDVHFVVAIGGVVQVEGVEQVLEPDGPGAPGVRLVDFVGVVVGGLVGAVRGLVDFAFVGHLSEDLVVASAFAFESQVQTLVELHTEAVNRITFSF